MKKFLISALILLSAGKIFAADGTVLVIDKLAPKNGAFVGVVDSSQAVTNTTNFNATLSTSETTTQKALDILNNFSNGLFVGTQTATRNGMFQDADGDFWIVANASYTKTTGRWNRIDTSKAAFGIEMLGRGLVPGEVDQGVVLWRAAPGTNPIGTTFGAVGGWELGWDITANRDLVVGGSGIELDGHGVSPFGRFVHLRVNGSTHTGVAQNIFADFSGVDSANRPSWFFGMKDDTFIVERATETASPYSVFKPLLAISTSPVTTPATGYAAVRTLTIGDLNCTGNANGGAITTDANGKLVCSDDDSGGGGGGGWTGGGDIYTATAAVKISTISAGSTGFTSFAGDVRASTVTFARFSGTVAGMSTPVTIVAQVAGTSGNEVTLNFDGATNIVTAANNWTAANPNITIAVSGDDSQTPNNGTSITLSGGDGSDLGFYDTHPFDAGVITDITTNRIHPYLGPNVEVTSGLRVDQDLKIVGNSVFDGTGQFTGVTTFSSPLNAPGGIVAEGADSSITVLRTSAIGEQTGGGGTSIESVSILAFKPSSGALYFQPPSSVSGTLSLILPSSATAGQVLTVASGGVDKQLAFMTPLAGSGGSDSMGTHVATKTITAPFGIFSSTFVVNSATGTTIQFATGTVDSFTATFSTFTNQVTQNMVVTAATFTRLNGGTFVTNSSTGTTIIFTTGTVTSFTAQSATVTLAAIAGETVVASSITRANVGTFVTNTATGTSITFTTGTVNSFTALSVTAPVASITVLNASTVTVSTMVATVQFNGIVRISTDGYQYLYTPTANTDVARGNNLRRATLDWRAGETLILGTGMYDMNTSTSHFKIIMPASTTIMGQGSTTILKATNTSTVSDVGMILPAYNTEIRDMFFETSGASNTLIYPIGRNGGTNMNIDVRLINLGFNSGSDGIYFEDGQGGNNIRINAWNLYGQTAWDIFVLSPSFPGDTLTARIWNSKIVATSTSAHPGFAASIFRSFTDFGTTDIEFYNCDFSLSAPSGTGVMFNGGGDAVPTIKARNSRLTLGSGSVSYVAAGITFQYDATTQFTSAPNSGTKLGMWADDLTNNGTSIISRKQFVVNTTTGTTINFTTGTIKSFTATSATVTLAAINNLVSSTATFTSSMTLSGGRLVYDSAPADTQVLQWSASNNRWQPGTVSGGSADNFGNHIATRSVDMKYFRMFNIGSSSAAFGGDGSLLAYSSMTLVSAPYNGFGNIVTSMTVTPTPNNFNPSVMEFASQSQAQGLIVRNKSFANAPGSETYDYWKIGENSSSIQLEVGTQDDQTMYSGNGYTTVLSTMNAVLNRPFSATFGVMQSTSIPTSTPMLRVDRVTGDPLSGGSLDNKMMVMSTGTSFATPVSGSTFTLTFASITINNASVPAMNITQRALGLDAPVLNFNGSTDIVGFGAFGPQGSGALLPIGYVRAYVNGVGVEPITGNSRLTYVPIFYEDCFDGKTQVLTPSGHRNIEDMKDGDEVYSMEPLSKNLYVNHVGQAERHPSGKITVVINGKIKTNNYHTLYVSGKWIKAPEIKIGDWMMNSRGEKVWIYSLESVDIQQTTYNLHMQNQGLPNYLIRAGDDDLLVHNKCPFLYFYNPDGKGEYAWEYQTTFLYNLDSKEKETVQRRKLKKLSNQFVIRELEPETSYIKSLSLIAKTKKGEVRLKWTNRPHSREYVVTKQGDVLSVQFEKLPKGTLSLEIEAEGYYVWHEEEAN